LNLSTGKALACFIIDDLAHPIADVRIRPLRVD